MALQKRHTHYSKTGALSICHLTTGHYAFDDRIFYKECATLSNAGFDVSLIAPSTGNMTIDGLDLKALPLPKGKADRIFKNTLLAFSLALRLNARLYHFHDPELILVGLLLKLIGKKVIYDVHEDVPRQIVHKNMFRNQAVNKLVATLFSIAQKAGGLAFDGIVGVTPSIVRRFPKEKSIIVRNYVILDLIDNAKAVTFNSERCICIYPGGLTRKRGLREIIDAMGLLKGSVDLLLMGKWESEGFMRECQSLEGWRYTKYLGHVKLAKVYEYMKGATIGLINYHESGIEAIPNKPFEFMACGLPMVMSNRPNWQKLFSDCALFSNPLDPTDVADKIRVLVEDSELRKRIADKGRKLVRSKFSWGSEGNRLVLFYNKKLKTSE